MNMQLCREIAAVRCKAEAVIVDENTVSPGDGQKIVLL
jgi:hypothetical protein